MSFSSLRMSIYMLLGSLVLSFVGSQVWALTMVDNPYVNFQANNCTIPAGKSMCPSTLYVTTYAGRTFSVANLNRGITTSNLLTPDNYTITPGSVNFAYTVSTNITGDAANYISYGDSNNLNLLEGTRLIARAITSAKCTSGTIWNGIICSTPGTASPIACTMEARMCDSGSIMPRNMNTCEWLPNQCSINPIDPLPPTLSSFSISCTKNTYMLGEAISCKIRGGTSIKTCWQTGKSAIEAKSCIYYGWTPDANGIDLSYNGSVSSPILGNYTLYARDSSGRVASTQVSYIDNRPQESIRMEVKSCTIENGKSRCAATVDVSAPAGKFFDLENVQRTTNSTNIIRPGIYTITTSVLGDDAANYLTYGINDLILREGGLPVARASGNSVCAINTRWNGQICTGATSPDPISIPSRVSMKTGNGDTIFSDELYKNISKNAYYPEEVTKNITLPTSPSVLLLSLASSKAQCSVTPNYKTDNGMTFSNNSKIVNRSDFPSFDMSVPSYSTASQIGSMFNGKLSTITVSCETSSESTKDFLIYKVTFWVISLQPTYIDFQANNCIIAVGKSTCPSSLFVRAATGKYFDVTNVTRGLTTSNLLNPTNYISVIGSTTPMYTTTTHITGDASNYLKYGVNDLLLKEGSGTIAKAVATAECAKGSTWNGQICSTSGAVACTDVIRFCEDGSVMPRDPNCGGLPGQCPTDDTVEINSINTINPTKPYGNPTIQVLSIGGMSVNANGYVEISKAPTAPLKVEGQITSIRSGYSIKLTSNKSDFFIMIPVSSQGVWSTIGPSTPDIYRSRLVVEGDNLLMFSLIDDATRKSATQAFVKVKVSLIRGGIIESPICMMADGTKGYCTTPPMTPPYPNCPSAMNTSKLATTNSFVYCPIDKGVEINPTNTINPKPPVRGTSGGIIAIPPTCIMAGGSTGSCLPSPTTPPTYPNCPKPGTSKVMPRYCPTRTGVIVPIENPTIPPCSTNAGESLTIGCINPVDVVIVDGVPLTPIEEALDAASRKRIDTMIARTRSRVTDMSVDSGVAFIDTSIKRILGLPNKTAKAKLIDTYTLSRLQSLRNTIKSSANGLQDDYIGLVDNVLSN